MAALNVTSYEALLSVCLQGLSAVVGAIMTARSADLARRGTIADISVSPAWLAAATRLFLALDIFKFGHLDLDSTVV
jgi:hypothetical protein